MAIFWENGGLNIKRFFSEPQTQISPRNRTNPIDIPTRMQILVTIGLGVLELWEGLNYYLPRAHSL